LRLSKVSRKFVLGIAMATALTVGDSKAGAAESGSSLYLPGGAGDVVAALSPAVKYVCSSAVHVGNATIYGGIEQGQRYTCWSTV